MTDVTSNASIVDDVFAKLTDFSDLKAAKARFDELFEQRRQEQHARVQRDAEQIDCSLVVNGHQKPKRGRSKAKSHEA